MVMFLYVLYVHILLITKYIFELIFEPLSLTLITHSLTRTHTHTHTNSYSLSRSLTLQSVAANKCPAPTESSGCLTPWLFIVVITVQVLVILGYSIYRQAQERNAKKFF